MNNKKSAFSYVELVISMSLIVMVVMLATPFLTKGSKVTTGSGKFVCYMDSAGVVWQKVKYISGDKETVYGPENLGIGGECIFERPKNASGYSVTLVSGGAAYKQATHTSVTGKNGSHGKVVDFESDLGKNFNENNEIIIKPCYLPKELSAAKNFEQIDVCIGRGGEYASTQPEINRLRFLTALSTRFYNGVYTYITDTTAIDSNEIILTYKVDSSATGEPFQKNKIKECIKPDKIKTESNDGGINLDDCFINANAQQMQNCLENIRTALQKPEDYINEDPNSEHHPMGYPTFFEEKDSEGYIIREDHIAPHSNKETTAVCTNNFGCGETDDAPCGCGGTTDSRSGNGGAVIIQWI